MHRDGKSCAKCEETGHGQNKKKAVRFWNSREREREKRNERTNEQAKENSIYGDRGLGRLTSRDPPFLVFSQSQSSEGAFGFFDFYSVFCNPYLVSCEIEKKEEEMDSGKSVGSFSASSSSSSSSSLASSLNLVDGKAQSLSGSSPGARGSFATPGIFSSVFPPPATVFLFFLVI